MPTIEELRKQFGSNPTLLETVATPSALQSPQFEDIDVKKAYEYGYNPSFQQNQEDGFARAYQENSSWTERWGNRGKALAAGTALEAFGGLTAIAYGGVSAMANGDITKVFDNDFSRMLDNSRESLAEATRNYYTKEQQDSLAGWVTSGKFIDDLTGGASFLLGAALTEAAAGLLTAGTGGAAAPLLAGNTARIVARAASLLKKADKAGDFTRLISYADDAAQVTKNVRNLKRATESGKIGRQWLTGAGYEASVEALGAKKEYEAKIDLQLSRGEITPEKAIELKQRADEAATASFFTNLALVGVSNMVQFTSLFRPDILTTMSKVPSRYKMGADGISNVDSAYNKFRRGSRYVTNVGAESLEEFNQTVINKTGESYVFNKYDTEITGGVLQTLNNFTKHAAEGVQNSLNQEGLQSAILGGVMGAAGIPTFGLTRGADGKRQWLSGGIAEAKNENFEEVRRVNELQQKFDSNTKQGAIQFIAETMGSENTKANWVNGVQQHAATQAEEIALQTGNVMAAKNAEHDRLFSFVQNRQHVGQASDIQDMLNSVKEMSPEQFGEQFGYENLSKEELAKRKEDTLAKAKERIDNINGALKQVESAFPQMSEDWKTAASYNLSKAKDVKSRLDQVSDKLVNELQVTSMFEEQAKSAQSQKETLQSGYDSTVGKLTAERNVILDKIKSEPTDQTDKLVNKRNQLSDQIDSLTETLNTDLRGIDAALEQVKKSSKLISKKGKKVEELDDLFIKNSDAIDAAIEQIAQDDPAKASELSKDFKDFKTLRDTHKRVIDEYNRLLTPQGTQAFEAKVETAKKEGTPEVAKQSEAETQNGEALNQQDGAVNDALVGPSNVADDLDMDAAMDSTLVDPESIEAKKADIERRRQEELKQESYRIPASKETRTWTDDDGTKFETTIITFKDGDKQATNKNLETGGITPISKYSKALSNETIYQTEAPNAIEIGEVKQQRVQNVKIVDKINDKYDAELAALTGKSVKESTEKEKINFIKKDYQGMSPKIKVAEGTVEIKRTGGNFDAAVEGLKERLRKEFGKDFVVTVVEPKVESNPPVVPAIAEVQPVGEIANELVVKDHYVYKENAEAYIAFTKLDKIDPSKYKIVPKTYQNAAGKYGLDDNEVTYEVFYTLPNDIDVYVGFIEDARYDRLNGKVVTEDTVKEWSKTTTNPEFHEQRWRIKKELGSKIKSLNFETGLPQFAKITDPKKYEPLTNYKYDKKTVIFYDNKFYEIDGASSKRVENAIQIGAYRDALDARNVDNIRDSIIADGDAVILTDKFLLPATRKKAYNADAAKESQDMILAEKYDSQGFILDSPKAKSLNGAIKLKIMLDVEQNASIKFDERKEVPGRYNLQFIVGKQKVFFSPANIEKHGLEKLIESQCRTWGIKLIGIDNYVTSTPETTFTPANWGGSKRIYRRVRLTSDQPVVSNTPAITNTPKVEVVEKQVESVPEKPVVTNSNPKVDILKEVIESGKSVQDMIKDLEAKGLSNDTKGAFIQAADDASLLDYFDTVEELVAELKKYSSVKPKIQTISNPTLLREDAIENLRAIVPSELISDEELNIAARNIQAVGDIEGLYDKFIYLARVITPGTEYHEAFHAVLNALISPVEKQNLMQQWLMVNPKPSRSALNNFRNSYSGYAGLSEADLLNEYIEESLADDFAKYMLKGTKPKALIGRIFDRIKRWLGLNSKIDQFFDRIKRGAFRTAPRVDEVNPVRVAKPNVLYADANKQNPLETRTGHVVITRINQRILSGQYKGIENKDKTNMAIKDTIDYYKSTYIDDVAVRKTLSQDTIDAVKSIIRALRNPENKEILDKELELIKSLYAAEEEEDDEMEDAENRNSDEGIVTKPVNQQDGFSKENIWKLWTVNTLYTDREFEGGPMVELPIDYYATQMHIKMLAKNYPKDRLWQVVNTFALNPNEVELKALLKRLEATIRKELNEPTADLTHDKMSNSFMYNAFILSNYKTDVEMFDLFWSNSSQAYEIGSANNSSIKRTTVNKWINNLATKPFTKGELEAAFNQIETMLETVGTSVTDIASALNRVGIDVSYDYIKYNTYRLGLQTPTGEDAEWFKAIESDEIPTLKELISPADADTETIQKMIRNSAIPTNVYADISGWLEKVAIGDSLFNTAVRKSTFKNVEGKTIYEIIYNSAESERMRAISNPKYRELVAEIKQNLKGNPESLRKETLKFMEFMNIPYQEYLTYQELVQWIADNPLVELLSKVEPKFIGGYKDNNDNRSMFSDGTGKVKTNMLLSFAKRGKKRKDTINYHLLNVKAGKTLQTIYGVKDQGFGTINSGNQLNDKTKGVLLDFFKQELNRIKRTNGFVNTPLVATSPDFNGAYKEEIKAYTDSKRKRGGLAFMQHADFIKEILDNPGYASHKAFAATLTEVKEGDKVVKKHLFETLPDTAEFYTNVAKDLESYWLDRAKGFVAQIAEEHKLKPDAIETMDAYINDAIISRGLYQLLAYDPALTVKDAIDQNKRAGSDGAAGPSSSGRIRFATVESAEIHLGAKVGDKDSKGNDKVVDADANQYDTVKAKIAELLKSGKMSKDVAEKSLEKLEELSQSKTDTSDATSWMTTEGYIEHYLKPFLKYDAEVAAIYKKIAAGIELTTSENKKTGQVNETEILNKKNAHASPRKLVYSNGVDYFKTATNVLTRYEFSIAKNDDPDFLISEYDKYITAKNAYIKALESLEKQFAYQEITQEVFDTKRIEEFKKYEPIVKAYQSNFIAIPGSEVGHNTLNRMQLHGLDMMAVDSASKKQKRKVGKLDTFNYHNTQVLDASFLREQVATDGVKIHVIDGTQKLSLIWSEQGTVEVLIDGVKVRVDTLSKAMQVQLGKRIVQGFQDLMPKIEKEGLAYYDYLKESLIASQQASGGNNYFIEFLQDDYNWNLPHIVGKVEASFFSATSKNTLKHKTDGTAVALLPGTMYNVLRDENDEVITRNYVRLHWRELMNDDGTLKNPKHKVTRLRHLVWDEGLGVFVSECILPEIHENIRTTRKKGSVLNVFKYMVGIRIPTQDKQSMLAMKLVDTLPSYKGSLGIMPAESVKLSGEDFDIDKKFINYFATFNYEGERVIKFGEYLRTGSVEDAWYEYTQSKSAKGNLVNIPKAAEFFALKERIKKLKTDLKEDPDNQGLKDDLQSAKDRRQELSVLHKQDIEDALKPIKDAFLAKHQGRIEDNIKAFKKGEFRLITPITLEESNNILLDIQLRMISNPGNLHIALTPAEMTPVEESIKLLTKFTDPKFANATAKELKEYVDSQGYVYVKGNHALDDKLKAFNNNDVGSKNIGVFALANTFYQYVMAEQVEPFFSSGWEIPGLGRKNDILSAFLSSSTDNDKVQHAAVLGLDQESSGILAVGVMMGYHPGEIMIPMLNLEAIRLREDSELDGLDEQLIELIERITDGVRDRKEYKEAITQLINTFREQGFINLYGPVDESTGVKSEIFYRLLSNVRTSFSAQWALTQLKEEIENVGKSVSKVQRIMSLNKGFKPTIYDNLRVLQAVRDLKRLKDTGKEPFAAYDLVTTHPYLKENVKYARQFMQSGGIVSKFFLMATDKIRSGFEIVDTMPNEAAKDAMVKSISIEIMNSILDSDPDLAKLSTDSIIGEKGDFVIASHNLLKASKFGKMYMMKVLIPNRVTTDSGETYATMNLDTWAVSNKFTEEKLQSNFTFANGKPNKKDLKDLSAYTSNLKSLMSRFKEIDSIADLEQREKVLKQIVKEFEDVTVNPLELKDGKVVSVADILLNDYSRKLQAQAIVKDVMQFRNSSVVKLLNPKSWKKISALFDTQQKAIVKNEETAFDGNFVEKALIHYAMSYENFTMIPTIEEYTDKATTYSDYTVTVEDANPLSKVAKFEFKDKKPIDAVPLQFVFRDGKGIKWIADEVTLHGQTYKSFDEVFKAVQDEGNEIQSVTYKPIDPDRMYWGNSEVLPHRHDKTKSLISTTKKGKAAKSGVDNQVNEGQVPFDDLTQPTGREYTPDDVTTLKPNEVFVFGSNEGSSKGGPQTHGLGAALLAKRKFGAIQGQSEGLQGQSYAVVTKKYWDVEKSSTLEEIGKGLQTMLLFAKANPNKKFLVTKLGSSLAGYSVEEIKGLFERLKNIIPSNVVLPIEYEVRDEYVATPIVKGINIYTGSSDKLGRRLTNPNWYAKDLFDVETPYKANASKRKAPQLNAEEALKYDMNLMYKLQVQKFQKNPELIDEINERGGLEFILNSEHTVGVKNSRWEGKGLSSNFIKVLAQSYSTVAKELNKFKTSFATPTVESKSIAQSIVDKVNSAPAGAYEMMDDIWEAIQSMKDAASKRSALILLNMEQGFFETTEEQSIPELMPKDFTKAQLGEFLKQYCK